MQGDDDQGISEGVASRGLALLTAVERDHVATVVADSQAIFSETGYLDATAFTLVNDRTICIHEIDGKDAREKDVKMTFLRAFVLAYQPTLVMTVSSAWMAKMKSGQDARKYLGVPVKDVPGAFEAIHYTIETARVSYHGAARIDRTGQRVVLAAIEWQECTQAEGRFANIIPRTRTTREGVN